MNEPPFGPEMDRAAEALAGARRVLVVSGAGISAESGVPTFRESGGLWEKHRIEDVATPEAFRRNPRFVWEFYEARREKMGACEPNDGHRALAAMEQLFESFVTVTQNIDGLHQKAGSGRVLELHGNLWRARCAGGCGHRVDPFPYPAATLPPPCKCGEPLRPEVVWFGEMLPEGAMEDASILARECDVSLVVGTSGAVWPAAGIPLAAREAGAIAIEVNPERTELTDHLDVSLRGASGSVLPELLARVRRSREAP